MIRSKRCTVIVITNKVETTNHFVAGTNTTTKDWVGVINASVDAIRTSINSHKRRKNKQHIHANLYTLPQYVLGM